MAWCNSSIGYHITTKFCAWHGSKAVVSCTKFHNNHFTITWMRVEWNFHQIWIRMEKLFMKWAPEECAPAKSTSGWTTIKPNKAWNIYMYIICGIYCTASITYVYHIIPVPRTKSKIHWYMYFDFVWVIKHALTHWGRDKMATIFLTTFLNAFSWMKIFVFWWKFQWNLFPRAQLTIFHHWFR